MKAALFKAPGQPLSLEEVPTPSPGPGEALLQVAACGGGPTGLPHPAPRGPGPGEALLQVAACGVCHTDLHYLDHGVPTFKKPPLILGHEISGTVARLGPSADGWKEGERALVPAGDGCGRCPPGR